MAVQCLHLAAIALALLLLSSSAEAGCYRHNRTRPAISPDDYHYNDDPTPLLAAEHLPRRFDWSDVDGKNLLAPSWGQHQPRYCGSCFAHGTLSMVQDRLKIRKRGMGEDVMLGRQSFLNCAPYEGLSGGCDGGDPIDIFKYMAQHGLPDESCYSYDALDYKRFDQSLKHCPPEALCRNCMPLNDTADTCWPVKTPILYRVKSWGKVETAHKDQQEHAMMSEIYRRGPVVCSVATPEAFDYGYRSGIYKDPKNYTRDAIDHNVEVTGWGEEDGVPFWIVRNSWGTFWGELGFFRLQRGINSLFVEDGDCWYAEPDYEMEEEVEDGELVGSMYGLVENPDAEHDHHHHNKRHHHHEEDEEEEEHGHHHREGKHEDEDDEDREEREHHKRRHQDDEDEDEDDEGDREHERHHEHDKEGRTGHNHHHDDDEDDEGSMAELERALGKAGKALKKQLKREAKAVGDALRSAFDAVVGSRKAPLLQQQPLRANEAHLGVA